MTPRAYRRELGSHSPLQIYLHDINDTPLLSAVEERELAERVALGDPYARDHMVKANLRLVVNIARLSGQRPLPGRPDRRGEPRLMRAVEGFNGIDGYPVQHLRQLLDQAVDPPRVMNHGKPIRLPAYMVSLLAKWKRVSNILTERLGRPPTPEEIGKVLRLSKKKVGIVSKAIRINNLIPHTETTEEDGVALDDMLTDERSKAPDDLPDRVGRPRANLHAARPARRPRSHRDPDAVRPGTIRPHDPS